MTRIGFSIIKIVVSIGAACVVAASLVIVARVATASPLLPAAPAAPAAQAAPVAPILPFALGREEITCKYGGTNFDDMLVHPGQPGASHSHDYFGALGVTAATTLDTVRGHGTTCPYEDSSAYWSPSLMVDGSVVRPTAMHVYYERKTAQPVEAFPEGFHMIVGNASARSQGTENPWIFFGCTHSDQERMTRVAFTTCADKPKAGSDIRNTFGIWLEFPNCWDGQPAVGPSMSLVYAGGPDSRCPADHPRRLPTLRTVIWYDLPLDRTLQRIRLASGPMGAAHSDFVSGWAPDAMRRLVNCINTDNKECP